MNIHYIIPGRADKNLGKAVNETVKGFADDDWICLMDIDSMPAYHEVFYKQVEQIAKTTAFGLIGCMTNRCGMKDQLLSGDRDKISHNTDWKHHREIAKQLYKENGVNVKECKTTIAGVFMLFKKRVFNMVGGWREGAIQIDGSFVDWHFCNDVRNKGFTIGIATGLYMIHQYRPDHTKPRNEINHLL